MLPPNPRRRPEREGETGYQKFVKYFSLIMSLVYPALGLFLILSTQEQVHLDPTIKKVLGGVLIVYGALRFYRTYQRNAKRHDRFRNEE